MGRHTWDPRSSPEKRKRADSKYPYAAEIGFQITGFRVCEVPIHNTLFPNSFFLHRRLFLKMVTMNLHNSIPTTLVLSLRKS